MAVTDSSTRTTQSLSPRQRTFNRAILIPALSQAVRKLDPRWMVKNPVMFVVEVGTVLTLLLVVDPRIYGGAAASRGYNLAVTLILLLTVLFANYAEAVAEARGRAQAASLRRTKRETPAKRLLSGGQIETVPSSELRKGDLVLVEDGDLIPGDGDVIEGIAYVDEAVITGETAPVLKEPGTDIRSSVTGGTRIISDSLTIQISANPGETFLDHMIVLVEGAHRQKTPNEIALTVVLALFTLIFLIVCTALWPSAPYLGAPVDVATLIALLVCLIPTTIGGLLSAIGIAGMDRVTRFNVLAMSGHAVEAAGDVHTLLLDKTGTITYGNRMACEFIPAAAHTEHELAEAALLASLADDTPEGKSIVELTTQQGHGAMEGETDPQIPADAELIRFTAETRISGIALNGRRIMKGAVDVICARARSVPDGLHSNAERIAQEGGTPLAVEENGGILGLIHLKDTVKPGIRERFADLRTMGIRTVMVTGDNPLTAAAIAREAGVDDFLAHATPEDKLRLIREEQEQGRLVAMTGDGTNDAPALAQADVGLAMNSGTSAAKEAANMVDLDSDPTKLLQVVMIGKQLLITRGAITTFSITNDVAKYFAIIPAMFVPISPQLQVLNVMHLATPRSAILSALIFNAIIIPLLIPLAMRGVRYRPASASFLLLRNGTIFGLGGVIVPFIGIKLIDMLLALFLH
jgi:potassium-transporting ATPase ATP-binding subunit